MAKYFSRSEFACKCGCDPMPTVDFELLEILGHLREAYGEPITVTSGVRCSTHNRAVGGGKSSQHLLGRAADIVVKDVPPHEVQRYLTDRYPTRYGIGSYDSFTHIDTRTGKARWNG